MLLSVMKSKTITYASKMFVFFLLFPAFATGDVDTNPPEISRFIDEATNTLPLSMREALQKAKITIKFAKLDEYKAIIPPPCTPPTKGIKPDYGVTGKSPFNKNSYTIKLNQNFKSEIIAGPDNSTKYECGYKNVYRLALATLIHELTHVYDSLTGLSKSLVYKNLANWHKGFFIKKSKNKLHVRSPDPYEFENISENLAVNMGYFVLDPQYPCRRPEMNEFLTKHFNHSPTPSPECKLNNEVHLSTSNLLVSLDHDRVYQIHYLLAEKGNAMESRWGHAMFRVIICAPGKPLGPDCMKDISRHIVISYLVNISGPTLNYLAGFFGGYRSQLYLYTMPEVINEYTLGQSRNIRSVPIKMKRNEMRQFIYRALEQYWGYQGDYYFLWNNCATEALDSIRGVMLESPKVQKTKYTIATPLKIYSALKKLDLIDESVLTGPEAQGRYFFRSFADQVEAAFNTIKSMNGVPAELTLDEYLYTYQSLKRRELYTLIKDTNPTETKKLAIQFYFIEVMIRDKLMQMLESRANKLVEKSSEGHSVPSEHPSKYPGQYKDWIERMVELRSALLPWLLVNKSYGIPFKNEYREAKVLEAKMAEIHELKIKIQSELKKTEKEIFDDLDGVSENIKFFMAEIKARARTNNNVLNYEEK
ncbi:MAG: DUF4105 domain-containing protein [Candidatus Poribacteria bacterium]